MNNNQSTQCSCSDSGWVLEGSKKEDCQASISLKSSKIQGSCEEVLSKIKALSETGYTGSVSLTQCTCSIKNSNVYSYYNSINSTSLKNAQQTLEKALNKKKH